MADPVDGQEQIDMGFADLQQQYPSVGRSKIVQWDVCLPRMDVTTHHPAGSTGLDKMRYIPLAASNFSSYTQGTCSGHNNQPMGQSHAERTTGILAGRVDSGYNPNRGFDSFLYDLDEIKVATTTDLSDTQTFLQRIKDVALAGQDVASWSAYYWETTPGYSPDTEESAPLAQLYIDYLSVFVKPHLNVFAAGNAADRTGHFVRFKNRNGLVVGGFHDGNTVPPDYTMYTNSNWKIDGYSSWRAPYVAGTDHGDRRLPHLSAVGTFVQSFDREVGLLTEPPYVKCDSPTMEPGWEEGEYWAGTSFAAPQAAAAGAYAMKEMDCLNPTDRLLAVQGARAVLMASANRNVKVSATDTSPAQVYHLVTGEPGSYNMRKYAAGAGGVNAAALRHVMGDHCVPGTSFGTFKQYWPPGGGTPEVEKRWDPPHPGDPNGRRCRVAMVWNPRPNCGGSPPDSCTESKGYDYDMCLYVDYNNQLLGCAMSWDNNYEYLDVPCPLNVVFRLELYPYSGTPSTYASVGYSLYTAENQ